jgi:hypothetical protein
VELAEWEFAIKIERDEPMFSRPFYSRSFCHPARLSDLFRKKKPKKACSNRQTWPGMFTVMNQKAFCICIDTVCEGRIPAWHDENGMPVVYPTVEAAQREIADDVMEKLRQFLEGERDFEDAMTVEDYILPVDVLPDGSILDEDGNCFAKKDW